MPGIYEAPYFLLTLRFSILGVFLGLVYDVFRIRRIAWSLQSVDKKESSAAGTFGRFLSKLRAADTVLIFFEDIVFFIFSSVSVILMHYVVLQGIIRAYSVFCVGLGFVIYYFTLGRLTVRFAEIIIAFIERILSFIFRHTLLPAIKIFKKLFSLIYVKFDEAAKRRYSKKTAAKFLDLADRAFLKQ